MTCEHFITVQLFREFCILWVFLLLRMKTYMKGLTIIMLIRILELIACIKVPQGI